METLNNIVLTIQDYLSNYILIVALVGGGIWFSIRTGFIQVRGFTEGLRRTFGGLFSKKGEAGKDGMSSFQALATAIAAQRSEEHTSELQSRFDLVCRLLLEKIRLQKIIVYIVLISSK